MAEPVRVRVGEVRQYIRNVRTRMPFRYGQATLTHVPILNLRTTVEDAAGHRAEGWSGDCLPPGWFDKRPGRTFREDIESLRFVVDAAIASNLSAGLGTPFELWYRAYHDVRQAGLARGENGLTCGFGSALVERSVIDAVGKLCGTELHETFRRNLLGIDLGELHEELAGDQPADYLEDVPRESMFLRHTIGLVDPLTAADVAPDEALDDGLPQTFEDYLIRRGVRFVKVKVCGRPERDVPRIRTIAALLEAHRPEGYRITLDGNELYRSPEEVLAFLDSLAAVPELTRFLASVEYLEQPLARHVALEPTAVAGLRELARRVPVAIDESDDRIEAYRTAIDLGYQGISFKNCKGVTKAFANYCLGQYHNRWRPGYFLTSEDLMNTAVLPVQQDLGTATILGLVHQERNGHHYVRGLDHLSPREVAGCLEHHGDLYEPYGDGGGQVRITGGRLSLKSLRVPGYAVAVEPDWDFLTPAASWRFEDLGMEE